jgi:predicted DNA binding CopG/RHH family protein
MKQEYDFSNAKPNPYFAKLNKQISIRLDIDTLEYFKKLASTSGIPYQKLINLYLADCAKEKKKISLEWK